MPSSDVARSMIAYRTPTKDQGAISCVKHHLLPASALSVDGVMVDPVTSVRDLGIYIDADLSEPCCTGHFPNLKV